MDRHTGMVARSLDLLVSERFNGSRSKRAPRDIFQRSSSHRRRNSERQRDGGPGDDRAPAGNSATARETPKPNRMPLIPPRKLNGQCFNQELLPDIPPSRPDALRILSPGAFQNARKHDIHNANAADSNEMLAMQLRRCRIFAVSVDSVRTIARDNTIEKSSALRGVGQALR